MYDGGDFFEEERLSNVDGLLLCWHFIMSKPGAAAD